MASSPTAEGFRAAFRRPSLTLAEIAWRWATGGTAAALFFFALFEYLDTLPVTNGELLFLRTRNPYLVAEAIAHILRGGLNRAAMAGLVAAFLLGGLWIVGGAVGRIATVRALLEYFRRDVTGYVAADKNLSDGETDSASNVSTPRSSLPALVRLNFLRVSVALAAILGIVGAAIVAGFASPAADPQPGIAFLIFVPLASLVYLAWYSLNWMLALAGMFAVRDEEDAAGAISAAVTFCRERAGAVFLVGLWTGLAHLVALVSATTVASIPLGLIGMVPWRLAVVVMICVSLIYFAVADWLYMARLAGYVCIAEMPEEALAPLPPHPYLPPLPPPAPPVRTSIDRDEPILSDLPGLA
jgi:hypothetical protein